MELQSRSNIQLHARGFSLGLAAAAATLAALALLGWLLDLPGLASFGREFIPMAPSTALSFLVLVGSLFVALHPTPGPAARRGIGTAGAAVSLYGFLVAAAWVGDLPISPDDWLFSEKGMLGPHSVGRMSPATGVLLVLSGLSLAALSVKPSGKRLSRMLPTVAVAAGTAVFATGTVFALAYAMGSPLLYTSRAVPLALPTALSFLLLGASLIGAALFRDPDGSRWRRTLDDLPIGTQLRLGLGAILVLVFLLGTLAWRQTDLVWLRFKTMYDHPFQVRRALGALEVDILAMRGTMKDVALAQTDREVELALAEIAIREADAL